MKDELENYYLPKWDDEKKWNSQYKMYLNSIETPTKKQELTKKYPTANSFRDDCYAKAETSNFSGDECNGRYGWCIECGRNW